MWEIWTVAMTTSCALGTVWPDQAIYWTLGNFLKPLPTINWPVQMLGWFYKILHIKWLFIFQVQLRYPLRVLKWWYKYYFCRSMAQCLVVVAAGFIQVYFVKKLFGSDSSKPGRPNMRTWTLFFSKWIWPPIFSTEHDTHSVLLQYLFSTDRHGHKYLSCETYNLNFTLWNLLTSFQYEMMHNFC